MARGLTFSLLDNGSEIDMDISDQTIPSGAFVQEWAILPSSYVLGVCPTFLRNLADPYVLNETAQ